MYPLIISAETAVPLSFNGIVIPPSESGSAGNQVSGVGSLIRMPGILGGNATNA